MKNQKLKFKVVDDFNQVIFNERITEDDFPNVIKKLREKFK